MKKLTIYLILLTFCACNAPQPNEPFYCKINGSRWRPEKSSYSLGSPLKAEWDKSLGRFNIIASNEIESIFLSVKLEPNKLITVKSYELVNDVKNSTGNYYYDSGIKNSERLVSKSGILIITNVANNQVSGTFEFTTYSDIRKKEYKITKGQFNNLNYTEF